MLVLFESAAGLGLFRILDNTLIEADPLKISEAFSTDIGKTVRLESWSPFTDTKHAMKACLSLMESGMDKQLKKFLQKNLVDKGLKDDLAVIDRNLGAKISKKLPISICCSESTRNFYRGIKENLDTLITGLTPEDERTMALGLSHSLNNFKLKFSPEKVDTMIIQAIGLLDELDKELNTFYMRLKEWYGWHFPELSQIVTDSLVYAKAVKFIRCRTRVKTIDPIDLEEVLGSAEQVAEVKVAAETSMGLDISSEDLDAISILCECTIDLGCYRASLVEYLKNRMTAVAPNLTYMVGEVIGAKLIAHAGSLMSLAKQPSSTIQILGAEKALFRALKMKQDTPKYGILFNAGLVGQSPNKLKGKIARVLAAKLAISVRVDAMGDQSEVTVGEQQKLYVENRIKQLDAGQNFSFVKNRTRPPTQKYFNPKVIAQAYNSGYDAQPSNKRMKYTDNNVG